MVTSMEVSPCNGQSLAFYLVILQEKHSTGEILNNKLSLLTLDQTWKMQK